MSSIRCFRRIRYQKLQPAQRFPPWDKGHGGCTSTILKCVNHSQGKKPTLSHLSKQLPNTEGTRALPDQGKQHHQTICTCRNPCDWMTADAAAPWRFTSLPGPTHTFTDDLSRRDKQHFQTTAICLHSALILCPQKRWGQHMTNVANSVLISHAGGEKPHQGVFTALLQGNSINLLSQYFWLGSGKGNPDVASLNLI